MGYNIAVQTEAHKQDVRYSLRFYFIKNSLDQVKCTLTFPSIPGTAQHDDQVLFNIITGSRDKSVKLWQVKRNSPQ